MSSFIIVSGILSTLSLKKIQVYRTLPEHVFARKPFSIKVTLTNHKRLFPSYSLLVEDLSQSLSEKQKAYSIKIPAKGETTLWYTLIFDRRGYHPLGGLKISTGYPFGLCVRSKVLYSEEKVVVYPKIEPIDEGQSRSPFIEGELETAKKGSGTDFSGIREYAPGDSSRLIHWKTTAKVSRLMVKEFTDEYQKKVSLIVDSSYSPSWKEKIKPSDLQQALDNVADKAASYAWHFIHQNYQVQLITPLKTISFDQGMAHLYSMLHVLALLEPSAESTQAKFQAIVQRLNGEGGLRIVVPLNGFGRGPKSEVGNQEKDLLASES